MESSSSGSVRPWRSISARLPSSRLPRRQHQHVAAVVKRLQERHDEVAGVQSSFTKHTSVCLPRARAPRGKT